MKSTVIYRRVPAGMKREIADADRGLQPCPFPLCDHHGGVVIDWEHRTGRYVYFAFCNSCNCRGPRMITPAQAARVWNERDPKKQVDVGP